MSIETMKLALAFVEGELTLPERDTEPSWNKEYKAQMENLIAKLRVAIEQAERAEPVATLFGSLPVYDVPTKQEPVAWMVVNGEGKIEQTSHYMPECERWLKYDATRRLVPLYTVPPQREWQNAALRIGEELSSVGPDGYYAMSSSEWLDWALAQNPKGKTSLQQREWIGLTDEEISAVDWKQNETLHDFAHAIEAKLKEKNNG